MYAVFRESTYAPGRPIQEASEFREFQTAHAKQSGYMGTIVTDVGAGRYLTVTLWETAADMDAARKALGPVVGRLLEPLMTVDSQLLGTGQVVVNDFSTVRQG